MLTMTHDELEATPARPRPIRRLGVALLATALAGGALGLLRSAHVVAPATTVLPGAGVDPVAATSKAARVLPRLYSQDLALGIVVGYAFSDGRIDRSIYTYDMGGEGLADQFRAAILDAGGAVAPLGEYAASSSGLPDLGLVTHGALPAAVLAGSADLRRGVLTAMVQCEGDPGGLVWDSPSRVASESVVALLATFGITARLRGSAFFDVVVGPQDFAFFQALPVAVRDRVPGTSG